MGPGTAIALAQPRTMHARITVPNQYGLGIGYSGRIPGTRYCLVSQVSTIHFRKNVFT